MRKCQVGGQAVIEGVMMRGEKGMATAIRMTDGSIKVDLKLGTSLVKRYKFLNIPIIRGFIILIESLIQGIGCLNYSSSFFEEEEKTPSKLEKWLNEKLKGKVNDVVLVLTLIISFVFGILIFLVFPTWVASFFKGFVLNNIGLNILEGVIRVSIFLIYMVLIGKMDDIYRLYQYHGAEHKTIFCYENEKDLTVDNVKKFKRFHPRCGTNFLFLVMIVSIFVFCLTGWKSILYRVVSRIVLIPLISGITYEIIRWVGRNDGILSKIIAAPGLRLQKLTTREPDDEQIEVAIAALKAAEGIENNYTVGELLDKGNKILKEAEVETYILDCQLILGKVLNKEKLWIITNRDKNIDADEKDKFFILINKRKNKMPMQYIIGKCEFMGVDFLVKPGVLIPRGDTEVLVEEVLSKIDDNDNLKICDLCCGTGAIGISLANYKKNISVDLIDIDDIPKEVTNINIEKLNLVSRANFIKSDLLDFPINNNLIYDIIVSNPPYIKEDIIPSLMTDVKDYEPKLALSGGEDGLDFYRKIILQSLKVLKNNGILAFEIGYDQGIQVSDLMRKNGYSKVKIIKDLAGLDRVVIGNLIEKN